MQAAFLFRANRVIRMLPKVLREAWRTCCPQAFPTDPNDAGAPADRCRSACGTIACLSHIEDNTRNPSSGRRIPHVTNAAWLYTGRWRWGRRRYGDGSLPEDWRLRRSERGRPGDWHISVMYVSSILKIADHCTKARWGEWRPPQPFRRRVHRAKNVDEVNLT